MEVIIQPTREAAALLTAKVIADEVRKNPSAVLGLATGATVEPVYANLIEMHHKEGLDFSLCKSFNLDEYVGLSGDHPGSYRYFMNSHLFDHINIDKRNTRVPNGMASDLAAECLTYEEAIWHAGGIDLQLVGIGMDGHIGFNEPMSSLQSRTRVKQLNPVTIRQNAGYFGGADKMPRRAITMGVGTILDSQRCVLLATGSAKAEILAEAIEGPFCARVTASALQWHRRAVVIVDEACAANLKNREYYDWSFAHEPEWAPFRG